jgi:hypothetical protein
MNTTGLEVLSGCQNPDTQQIVDSDHSIANSNLTILGSWSGCNVSFQVPDTESDQFGVQWLSNCQQFPLPPEYLPVLFWFYSFQAKQSAMVFCQPELSLWNMNAGLDMHTGLIDNVTLIDQNVTHSNLTGLPSFNVITFNTTGADNYVLARQTSIQTAVPFAIYKGAEDKPGGVPAVIQQPDGFLNITIAVYTRYLAMAAKNVYFVGTQDIINGNIETYEVRLWVYPLDAHVFAGCLLFIAIVAAINHFFHIRARRNVYVSCDASTIAGALSMTSRSNFPKLLHAGMDEDELHRVLKGMRFGISPTTWQIVAAEDESYARY